jgi:diguanylate cyclase (GGDEF)-like protein/PAS domain S-box-containing protein
MGGRIGDLGRGTAGDPAGLAELLDGLGEIVFETDPEGNWTYLNAAWERATGFPVAETLGRSFLEFVHPDERDATLALFGAVLAGRCDRCHHDTRYLTADGGFRWFELRARIHYGEDGRVLGNSGAIIDITERRRAETLLAGQGAILELIARDAPLDQTLAALALMVARDTGNAVELLFAPVTPSAPGRGERLAAVALPDGRAAGAEGAGAGGGRLRALAAEAAAVPEAARIPLPETGAMAPAGELVLRGSTPGGERELDLAARCAGLAVIALERARTAERMRRMALRDPLTGLPNRILVADRLSHAVAATQRRGTCGGLMVVDLDGFKAVNDALGHAAGDDVLREVGARLRAGVREADTVGRLGGDEFAVVLAEVSGADEALRTAERVRGRIGRPIVTVQGAVEVAASVGVAVAPEHAGAAEGLMHAADAAMYRAKRTGAGTALFDPGLDDDAGRALGEDLLRAIEDDDLELHYQPMLDLDTRRTQQVEALVRWRRGDILEPPSTFIPLAEHTGLIHLLSRWVLERAAQDVAAIAPDGSLGVAVNLSAHCLYDDSLSAAIRRALGAAGLPPATLELEITETLLLTDPDRALATVGDLLQAGVRLAVDDFGTGFSSLAQLRRLPVGTVKVDRVFVRDVATDARDALLVKAAVDLAHGLGMRVVAEGVEDAGALDLLTRMGCDAAQGWAIARPMTAGALDSWLAAA